MKFLTTTKSGRTINISPTVFAIIGSRRNAIKILLSIIPIIPKITNIPIPTLLFLFSKIDSDFDKTVYAYTKTSIAIADAFISCWDEKYRSNLIRPETLINEHFDDNWKPVLQTPPFPEYVSGHSVASGAAAITLTNVFGDNFAFDDDTELIYGLPIRSFSSFNQAADEAAISRMYGGIHYRAAVEIGVKQGRDLGKFVVDNLEMLPTNKE